MTLPIGPSRSERGARGRRRAFTLIELILVMAMLLIVLAVAFPSLKGFFHGRNLDSEARRFLSLTHYGQSRAVSEGVPMVLWIDARRGSYGLQMQAGYADVDPKAVEVQLGEGLQMEALAPVATGTRARTTAAAPSGAGLGRLPMIRFTPDGFLGDSSPARVLIRQGTEETIGIVASTNRLNYEIESTPTTGARR